MPFLINGARRGGRALAAALVLAALIAGPAHAATVTDSGDCRPDPQLSQIFAPWQDFGFYTPAPNGGVEDGTTGWTLSGGAAAVDGNEPWQVGGAGDSSSLDLPAGSSATTAPMCIDETYPYFRLFARNAEARWGSMRIEVLFLDSAGDTIITAPYTYVTSSTAWQPTGKITIGVVAPDTSVWTAPVAFRFTPIGTGSHFQIDDVYVDPWARN